jgi:1-aminocyclopropane-1-carboxylate deaminase
MFPAFKKPILEEISFKQWENSGLQLFILREDLVHPFISGNKWRKLKYNIEDFRIQKKKIILTFGGVYSNHLVATAAASREYCFKTIGIVRGEDTGNQYLTFMKRSGMKLHFISRSDYRKKNDIGFISSLLNELIENNLIDHAGDVFILPEGGSNASAVKGAAEITNEIPSDSEYIVCACGTGATIAGISQNLLPHQKAIGISVLKADNYFENEIKKFEGDAGKITIKYDYHLGGYARTNETLLNFCKLFHSETKIPVEPVYTGKLFFAMDDLIRKHYFKSGSKVTLIHTGGVFQFENLRMC